MKLLVLIVLLPCVFSCEHVNEEFLLDHVQQSLLKISSVMGVSNLVVIVNVGCHLRVDFFLQIHASSVSYSIAPSDLVYLRRSREAHYTKIHLSNKNKPLMFLVVTCPLQTQRRLATTRFLSTDRLFLLVETLEIYFQNLVLVEFRRIPEKEITDSFLPFSQIRALWNDDRQQFDFSSNSQDQSRGYSSFLNLYFNFDPSSFRPLKITEMTFDLKQAKQLTVRRVELTPSFKYYVRVELYDPGNSNTSIEVRFRHSRVLNSQPTKHYYALYVPVLAVARVPSISKSYQVARSIFDGNFWMPLTGSAFAATLVLWFVKENFFSSLFFLLANVATAVCWKVNRKPFQYLLIIGTWSLFLQVIGVCYRGLIVASLQALPEGRRLSVQNCIQTTEVRQISFDGVSGIIVSTHARTFLFSHLAFFLRGGAICGTEKVLQKLFREVLRLIPVYRLTASEVQFEEVELEFLSISLKSPVSEEIVFHKLYNIGGKCCTRLVRMELAFGLIQDRYMTGMILYQKMTDEMDFLLANMPLSPTYKNKVCVNYVNSTKDFISGDRKTPIGIKRNKRCFKREDLELVHREGLDINDIPLMLEIVAFGMLLACSVYVVENAIGQTNFKLAEIVIHVMLALRVSKSQCQRPKRRLIANRVKRNGPLRDCAIEI